MKRFPSTSLGKLALSAIALATLGGCATVSLEQNVARVNEEAKSFAEGQISLARTADEREQRAQAAQKLLQTILGQREAVQLIHVLNHVLGDAADYAEQRGVDCRLTVMPDSERVLALGDPNLLQRAFDNVLQNALDHTPPGRQVSISLKTLNERLVVDITDEGPGVSESTLRHLFEPFYRADKSRGGKGWGLGLAIARDILGLHDGQIEASNAATGGLAVRLSLPIFHRNARPSGGTG